jgi:HSP20 family protein
MVYRSSQTSPVLGLRREIDRLFEDTFGRDSARTGWTPPVDVREDSKEIVLEVELPGLKPDDVEVTAENGILTIRGDKQSRAPENNEGRYHVTERSYGSFTRSFQLPNGVDERHIEAEFSDGVLLVRVPKAALAQPRRIEIRNSGDQPAVQGPVKNSASEKSRSEKGSTDKSSRERSAMESSSMERSSTDRSSTARSSTEKESGSAPKQPNESPGKVSYDL